MKPAKLSSIGKRKPYTIYVDKRVYRSFRPLAERIYGKRRAVSRALEVYMMAEVMKADEAHK